MSGEIKTLEFSEGVSVVSPVTIFQFFELEDDSGDWDGATSTKTYDVSATISDARKMDWSFQDAANNRRVLQGADIDFPSATQVRVSFGVNIPSGTYWLIGVGAG